MTESEEIKQQPSRKPYTPPRIRVIELDTKETMATACKTQGNHMGMSGPHCGLVGGHAPCMEDGS